MTTATATQERIVTTEITRGETHTHVVPGTYANGRSESFPLAELLIDGTLVGVVVFADTDHEEIHDPCKRCGVGGHYSFNGVDSICYGCHGYSQGAFTTEADIVRRYVNRRVAAERRERKAREAAAKQAAELAAWEELNAPLAEALKPHRTPADLDYDETPTFRPRDRFLTDLADKATYRPLTVNQAAAANKALGDLRAKDEARAAARGIQVAAGHWGTVGKRAEVTVEIKSIKPFDGDYGTTWLITMVSTEGHELKTWATGGSAFVTAAQEAEIGGGLVIKATVKAHEDYRGVPQTLLTRCTALA